MRPSNTQHEAFADAPLVVEGKVVEVLLGMGLAHLRASDGSVYGLRPKTPGVEWRELRAGQRFRCQVTMKFNRVLQAELLR